jgi:TIR domain
MICQTAHLPVPKDSCAIFSINCHTSLRALALAAIWFDSSRRIEFGDRFNDRVRNAIEPSDILLVVLSENWIKSEYCRKQLECFAERWRHEGQEKLRIIIVSKRHVDPTKRPSMLEGQEGYPFYALNNDSGVEGEYEFYKNGEIRDQRYIEQVDKLGSHLVNIIRANESRHL